ncbi:hypothetical protein SYK_32090 [Pseudodesulfovibrio nedwellii]|uniref:Protein CR006 P-loop domain-containing protein n=1 Tax=Pseudodesulfovibrio nedwellii TaxID=2973072 RepID=A0ABM8B4V1_9BACT|nr:AAA family ATPase [Pseudodesulfovibrio nedwellii]BDQ38849.1 hypothetical protein SYK_32090 [Pseudodesulfovibrio nedwellii]
MPVKIEFIRSVGRFSDFTSKGNTTFFSLVSLFAPNGNGKSTLSDLLRSLQSGDADILVGRHTLNSDKPSEAAIKLQDGKQARFNGTKWNRICPDIAIFDEVFVAETVHSGSAVEPHQRQRLHQVVIGKESVALQSKMDAIDESSQRIKDKITIITDKLETVFPDLKPKTVSDIPEIEDIDNKIKLLKINIANLKLSNEIKKASPPQQLIGLASPCNTASCLATGLPGLTAAAREKVTDHLKSKKMETKGEKWLQMGMDWSDDGYCPFCAQNLAMSPLFELFETYFDETYKEHLRELEQVGSDIKVALGDKILHEIQLAVTRNETAMAFWEKKINAKLPVIDVDILISSPVNLAFTGLIDLLESKKQNPIKSIQIVPDTEWITELQQACELIHVYNEAVAIVCEQVEELRESLEAGNLVDSEKSLISFLASKKRHSPDVSDLCKKYIRYEAAKKKLTNKKAEIRASLNKLCEEVLVKHGRNINKYLRQFGTNFKIDNLGTNHIGGKARTNFEISINDCSVKTTNGKNDTPHFGNTISTGDKRALAFAFFLSVLNQDADLKHKMVVFDDPFSSLDSFRRSRTKDRILELVGKARVVFVMSHDRDFLWHVSEKAGKQQTALKIIQENGSSVIAEWDISADLMDQYQKDVMQVRDYANGDTPKDLLSVARALRPVFEGMFRREFPEMFGPQQWLNNMIDAVVNAGEDDRIARFKPVVRDFIDIKNYTNSFHHSDEKKDKVAIDPEELKSYAVSVLYILDGGFEKEVAA